MMNKKGGLTDGIFIIIALFALGLVFIFMYLVMSNVDDNFQSSSAISAQGKSISADLTGKFPALFDKIFLFIVVGLGIAMVVGAFFINSHPALFWFSIPVLAFIIWLGALFANIFNQTTANSNVVTYASSFPIMRFIFQNYVIVITVFILLLAIALYGKTRFQQNA